MPTRATEVPPFGTAAKAVSRHLSALIRREVDLAVLELKRKLAPLGLGIGLAFCAAVLALFALGFGVAAGAAALATTLSTWLALLIVSGALVVLATSLGLLALRAVKKGTPPVPEKAIAEAKLTVEAVKVDGGRPSH